ncbi:MAG: tRNA (adenosine(37)-N6)-threonylcarbamoyltransferase complex ATPase subunit type 1 TsaE [Burkholderiales bacterium]
MKRELTRHLPDEHATLALGAALAQGLRPGLVVYLHGDLGAGKTTLVRGVLKGLGYGGRVKSPTYTLVELYPLSKLSLYHFDFYRFADPREWLDAGFREAFGGEAVCLVEWPEKAGEGLPPPDLDIHLSFPEGGTGRTARLVAHTEAGAACLERLAQELGGGG